MPPGGPRVGVVRYHACPRGTDVGSPPSSIAACRNSRSVSRRRLRTSGLIRCRSISQRWLPVSHKPPALLQPLPPGKLLRQPQREGQLEAWCLNWSSIVGRLKSRSIGKSCTGIDFRWTEIGHARLKRRIPLRGRPRVSVGHRSWSGQPGVGMWNRRERHSSGQTGFG
jgi:hypothetical protein